jgi:hypothetical protein
MGIIHSYGMTLTALIVEPTAGQIAVNDLLPLTAAEEFEENNLLKKGQIIRHETHRHVRHSCN